MKKIFIGFALGLATLVFAQQYPNNGWGNDGYYGNNDGYYSDDDDRYYFPDDYYYNYPQDYYPQDYYNSYYNDYRQSIISINWNQFFIQHRLNRWQIDQIIYLNNLYSNFAAWNNFYRFNPDRWYYDRFFALERILGPRIFVVFQNNYYQGYSPIVYFQNYRRTHYLPRFRVTPKYRNVNINIYKVDRNHFRSNNNPTLNVVRNSGFRNGNNAGGRSNNGVRSGSNGGFRNSDSGVRSNSGVRGNNGVRGNSGNGSFRNEVPKAVSPRSENNAPRNNSVRSESQRSVSPRAERSLPTNNGNGEFRSQPKRDNSSPRIQNSSPRQQNRNNEGRGSGFRGSFAGN